MSRKNVVRLLAGIAVVVVLAVSAWPGSWPRTAVSALTQHFGCFVPSGDNGPRTIGFGDSITAGHTFADLHVGANDSYFDMLACSDNSPIRDIGNAGSPGATTTVLLTRLQDVIDAHPDQVLVLAGTNDIFLGQPENTIPDLEQMRQRLDEAGIRYKFGTLPPSNLNPDATIKMNASIREWAADHEVQLVDYYTPLADADGNYREGLSDDGMHPSKRGAAIMATTAAAALR